MPDTASAIETPTRSGTALPPRSVSSIPIMALGMGLGSFLALTFVLCVLFDLWLPAQAMNAVWAPLLPGFIWLTWPSFLLGLIEAFAYGWYIALVFGPLYNFFARRFGNAA
jgi:uncharacterized membrane protein